MRKEVGWFYLFFTLFVAGCAGTDGSGIDAPKEVVITGPIESVEDFTVQGISFETDQADIFVNGENIQSTESLLLGQVVTVTGVVNNEQQNKGVADLINYIATAQGRIEDIDVGSRQIVVMNQTFELNDQTLIFDAVGSPINFDELDSKLAVGDIVEISALTEVVNNQNVLTATRIDTLENLEVFTVVGIVDFVDEANNLLNIGDLIVDYSSAVNDEAIVLGDLVRIEGKFLSDDSNILTAEKISTVDDNGNLTEINVFIGGSVTEFFSPNSFKIRDFDISTNSETIYFNGTADDVSESSNLGILAILGQDGIYQAISIEIIKNAVNTLADISTPLTYIYAPIEDIRLFIDGSVRSSIVLLGTEYPLSYGVLTDDFKVGQPVGIFFTGDGTNYGVVDEYNYPLEVVYFISDASVLKDYSLSGDHRIVIRGAVSNINQDQTVVEILGKKIYISNAKRILLVDDFSRSVDGIQIGDSGRDVLDNLDVEIDVFVELYVEGRVLSTGDIVADLIIILNQSDQAI